MTFSENLASLASIDQLQKLELLNADGSLAAVIENKAGSQGSLKVYQHLWKKHGSINVTAAEEGLALYAEHTADAEQNPGKHPNIDRLINIIKSGQALNVKA